MIHLNCILDVGIIAILIFRCHMHRECKQRNENRHMFFAKEKQSSDLDDMKAKIKSTDVRHVHQLTFLD